ncbi:MAG TPA: hypothetical protein DD435_11915 [Cyanobacteria bacterium UBA8530]|nr:hypothetical protein [Cyanobacteria bacterium UBA8530]
MKIEPGRRLGRKQPWRLHREELRQGRFALLSPHHKGDFLLNDTVESLSRAFFVEAAKVRESIEGLASMSLIEYDENIDRKRVFRIKPEIDFLARVAKIHVYLKRFGPPRGGLRERSKGTIQLESPPRHIELRAAGVPGRER